MIASVDDGVAFAVRWLSAATIADWVLLGLAGALLWLAWRKAVVEVQLGTVEISADTDGGLSPPQLAVLREELAKAGLVPSGAVPAGTPKANLVAAIEKAPVPQGPWLAALIDLIPSFPSPPSFEVTATLRDVGNQVGVTYRVMRSGTALGVATEVAAHPEEAIRLAANGAYHTIAKSLPAVFPGWALWPDEKSFERYTAGLEHERRGELKKAFRALQCAEALAPRNMLARLAVANRVERHAVGSPAERIAKRVEALDLYLKIAEIEPSIYQARFRAMVLLSVLADTWTTYDPKVRKRLARALERVGAELATDATDAHIKRELARLSRREARFARRRLKWSYTFWTEGRLRHRFELRDGARRRASDALATSKATANLRRQRSRPSNGPRWFVRADQAVARGCWRLRVALRYWLPRPDIGWQAHYNAACFYAQLPASARAHARAYKHLRLALRDPAADLDEDYVRHEDPDLEPLRADQATWRRKLDAIIGPALVIHYHRPDATEQEYWRWQVRLRGDDRETARRASVVRAGEAQFWVPVGNRREPLRFRLLRAPVNGDRPLDDGLRTIAVHDDDDEIWLVGGDATVHRRRPEAFPA
jgi:hypothetical protein